MSDAGWTMEGLTDNYIRVTAVVPERRWNQMDEVELVSIDKDGIRGKVTIPPQSEPISIQT